jgi:hypothetical protein
VAFRADSFEAYHASGNYPTAGATPITTKITVYIPCAPNQNGNVYSGDYVWFVYSDDGTPIALHGQDDAVGTIKLFSDEANIPRGWSEVTAMRGKHVVAAAAPGGTGAFGASGTEYDYVNALFIVRIAPP